MRIVLEAGLDHERLLQKMEVIEEIYNRQPDGLIATPVHHLSPFIRQTGYHLDVAEALALRTGNGENWRDVAFLFDILFVTDDMISNPGW
jgi:hypothetical protein